MTHHSTRDQPVPENSTQFRHITTFFGTLLYLGSRQITKISFSLSYFDTNIELFSPVEIGVHCIFGYFQS